MYLFKYCIWKVLICIEINSIKIESAINLLRGQIHEQLGCSDAAIDCYKSSLQGDVYCFEAFKALSSNQMLTPKDGKLKKKLNCLIESFVNIFICILIIENQLVQSLPIESQCTTKEAELVKYIYATKLTRVNFSF